MIRNSDFDRGLDGTEPRCPICQASVKDSGGYCIRCGMVVTTFNIFTALNSLNGTASPGPDTLCGRVLDDKYKLIRQLGEGSMGAVYLAHRLRIGDKVAVKVLKQETCSNDVTVKRFRREATIAAKSCDPRIVKIYDSGETQDGIIYLVMELVAAPTMRVVLEREGHLSPERVVWLMIEICSGIDAAHRQGIVHRDLKPENIIILPPSDARAYESVMILDFGIAKPLNLTREQVLTEPGTLLGTLFYISPEQLRGDEDVDARADIYSLGAVAYELLTGKPPFPGMSVAEVIAKHILEAPPPLPANLKIKPALESVVMRALDKDPNNRYRSAKELAGALRESLLTSVVVSRRKRWLEVLTQFRSFF